MEVHTKKGGFNQSDNSNEGGYARYERFGTDDGVAAGQMAVRQGPGCCKREEGQGPPSLSVSVGATYMKRVCVKANSVCTHKLAPEGCSSLRHRVGQGSLQRKRDMTALWFLCCSLSHCLWRSFFFTPSSARLRQGLVMVQSGERRIRFSTVVSEACFTSRRVPRLSRLNTPHASSRLFGGHAQIV